MKRLLALTLFFAIAAGAAEPARRKPLSHDATFPDWRLRQLARQLNLTAEQQKNILPILKDYHNKSDAIWQEALAKRHAAALETDGKISTMLTADQKQKYQALRLRENSPRPKPAVEAQKEAAAERKKEADAARKAAAERQAAAEAHKKAVAEKKANVPASK